MSEQHPQNLVKTSFWFSELVAEKRVDFPPMEELSQDGEADVCIVGAGYTGLWLAYELLRESPQLQIIIVEARYPGYGASGRNGGAIIPRINGSRKFWSAIAGKKGVEALESALIDTVDEVGEAIRRENIDCKHIKSGMLELARSPLELQNLQSAVEEDRLWGHSENHIRLLSRHETMDRIAADGSLGAKFTANAASVQPAALALGLASTVVRMGAKIHNNSPVTSIGPRLVETAKARVRAKYVVSAAEAYTHSISSERNRLIPVHTSMLATEPLSDDKLAQLGWKNREVLLADHPFLHLQRTASGRITIGGDDNRITYKYGSKPCQDGATEQHVLEMYRGELIRLFPALKDVRIERSWQGVFGARRDWAPAVGLDEKSGLAWIGGYVGEGLAASNLAARTLRDLILDRQTPLIKLPIVRRRPRNWEPEPLRMIGATAILTMRHLGEQRERQTGKASGLIKWGNRLAGFTGFSG